MGPQSQGIINYVIATSSLWLVISIGSFFASMSCWRQGSPGRIEDVGVEVWCEKSERQVFFGFIMFVSLAVFAMASSSLLQAVFAPDALISMWYSSSEGK